MTTVKDLIKILQKIENQDAEVFISVETLVGESSLHYIPDPSNPDESIEVEA